jgi:plastocyanin
MTRRTASKDGQHSSSPLRRLGLPATIVAAVAVILAHGASPGAAQSGTGTIKGLVKVAGPVPANPLIRMGVDPMCSRANAGKRLTQQIVVAGADGGLANVVVQLDGKLPAGTPPADPVVINQKGCVYSPRVVTAQPGQTLRVINSDTLLHEVHTTNTKANEFSVTQPQSGMVFNQPLKKDNVVMRLACSVHSWMTAYVAIVPHAFSDVTDDSGTFTLARVPAGKYTIQTWHERYGKLSRTVDVPAGGTATINFDYTGKEKPQKASIVPLLIPAYLGSNFSATPLMQ